MHTTREARRVVIADRARAGRPSISLVSGGKGKLVQQLMQVDFSRFSAPHEAECITSLIVKKNSRSNRKKVTLVPDAVRTDAE